MIPPTLSTPERIRGLAYYLKQKTRGRRFMADNNEVTLIEQAKHDAGAFLNLYDQYVDRIYWFAYCRTGDEQIAKDITSATFEKALRNIQRYRQQGVPFSAWLYRIARNELGQHYRRWRLLIPLSTNMPVDL